MAAAMASSYSGSAAAHSAAPPLRPAAAAATQPTDSRLAAFLADAGVGEEGMPPEIAASITAGLSRKFETPPVAALEACLKRGMPADKARQILFYPEADDMRLYAQLLSAEPQGAGQDHPQFKVMVAALTGVYMVHCKHLDRMRPFIEAGGLNALVALLAHDNLHVVSQAMTSLLAVTREELYPWHDPPQTDDGRGPRDGPDRLMWRRMYELSRSAFIPNLLRHQPDTFPGSSHLALRLLAFYLSWLRVNFTQNQELRLSAGLLSALQEWAARPALMPEEGQLAKALADDFGRFPPAGGASAAEVALASGQVEEWEADEPLTSVVADVCHLNSYELGEAERLKEAGNRAYGDGDYGHAIELYTAALDVPVPLEAVVTEAPRRAVHHCNRAAAYLARADAPHGLSPGVFDAAGLLEGVDHGDGGARERHYRAALLDAESALQMSASYARAHLRRATALARLGRRGDAKAAARKGQGCLSGAQTAVAKDLAALLQQLEADSGDGDGGNGVAGDTAAGTGRPAAPDHPAASQPSALIPDGSRRGSSGVSDGACGGGATADLLAQLGAASTSDVDAAAAFVVPGTASDLLLQLGGMSASDADAAATFVPPAAVPTSAGGTTPGAVVPPVAAVPDDVDLFGTD